MTHPRLVVCGFDDWVADQLAPLAADHRWLVKAVRQPAAALRLAHEPHPTVLVVQADPTAADPAPVRLVCDVHVAAPDVAVVVVSDVKLGDADRAGWTAAVFDLGARFVLFPPLSRPVLEDLIGGLMAAVIARVVPDYVPPVPSAGPIDLAAEGHDA